MASSVKSREDERKEQKATKKYGPASTPSREGLRIGHININSLRKKLHIVTALIHSHQFDIFVVGETHLTATVTETDMKIQGYKDYRFDQTINSGGGIVIYVRDTLFIEHRQNVYQNLGETNIQYLSLQITKPIKCEFSAIYRPPDQDPTILWDFMKDQLEEMSGKPMVFIGDFNVNFKTKLPKKIKKMEETHNLAQYIEYPTRVSANGKNFTSHLLDQIFTNIGSDRVLESGIIRTAISDHDLIYCTLSIDADKYLDSKFFWAPADLENISSALVETKTFREATDAIHEAAKYMGPIHGSYSSPQMPSGKLSNAVKQLSDEKWTFLRDEDQNSWERVGRIRKDHMWDAAAGFIQRNREIDKGIEQLRSLKMEGGMKNEITDDELRDEVESSLTQWAEYVGFDQEKWLIESWSKESCLKSLKCICQFLLDLSPERMRFSTADHVFATLSTEWSLINPHSFGIASSVEYVVHNIFAKILEKRYFGYI